MSSVVAEGTRVSGRGAPAGARAASRARWRVTARRRAALLAVCLFILLAVPSEGYLGLARITWALRQAIGNDGFRLAAWEVQALGQKGRDLVARPGAALTPEAQRDLVLAYFAATERARDLADAIERIYADPRQADPASAAAPLRAALEALRAEQAVRRPAVESILERQTATVLAEMGLGMAGRAWPPVRFQFTESPLYLIVSPRNRITLLEGLYLDPGLDIPRMEQIESQVQTGLDVSALVEGTGGFSSYPTMVIENESLEWVLNTIAHEWAHTYLVFRPLGWHYDDSSDMRTMNETVASIVGDEVGRAVLLRYYPELARPEPWPRPPSLQPQWWGQEPEADTFRFGAFMRETRLEVDRLLAAGRVTEAEDYMEARRQILVQRGYAIRKLNQAYFAFHGSYAVGPAATDPIGAKLRALRQRTASLAAFVQAVARLTGVSDLDALLQ